MQGAKAGALNIALQRTRPDASHIITIDADYKIVPEFLNKACRALQKYDDDFIRFPQAYRKTEHVAQGLDLELGDYFHSHARSLNSGNAMLLTGTLNVISVSALAIDNNDRRRRPRLATSRAWI